MKEKGVLALLLEGGVGGINWYWSYSSCGAK